MKEIPLVAGRAYSTDIHYFSLKIIDSLLGKMRIEFTFVAIFGCHHHVQVHLTPLYQCFRVSMTHDMLTRSIVYSTSYSFFHKKLQLKAYTRVRPDLWVQNRHTISKITIANQVLAKSESVLGTFTCNKTIVLHACLTTWDGREEDLGNFSEIIAADWHHGNDDCSRVLVDQSARVPEIHKHNIPMWRIVFTPLTVHLVLILTTEMAQNYCRRTFSLDGIATQVFTYLYLWVFVCLCEWSAHTHLSLKCIVENV